MAKKKAKANQMWGGHYASAPDDAMLRLNASIGYDWKLYKQDIRGSKAHSAMLAKQGIISARERDAIHKGLSQIEKEIETGKLPFDPALEDIHMHIESRLKMLVGDAAGKLHTARSRNDQVVTDVRLYVRDAVDALDAQLKQLQRVLIDRAEEHATTLLPGFTHLQTTQPVTLGHHLLAYVEMFGRDRSRLSDCRARLNLCPLGSAALAGTPHPIDRMATAKSLGFDAPTHNSMDSVSDRDFILEFLSHANLIGLHLSRLGEELVLWSSKQFGFITLSEAFTTGSSIMPQKRNPDGAELLRAKIGRLFGNYSALLMVMKGLPLAYNKDTQEDKEPLFDTVETLSLSLPVTIGMVKDFTVHAGAMRDAVEKGFPTATDLADWLVKNLGMPFREAHHVTGAIVRKAEQKGCTLSELPLADMQKVERRITKDIFTVLSVEYSVKSRTSYGGTAPINVKRQLNQARKRFL